jgi:hypothetical protein
VATTVPLIVTLEAEGAGADGAGGAAGPPDDDPHPAHSNAAAVSDLMKDIPGAS